ncbi:MAG: redox-sensitive bicupin YhaK (pirin superfamily), partial [Flavobacteriales bacterium]
LGATARFGAGDVQWMTAGKGIVHSESFPLLNRDEPNPTELFQIWLNLPRDSKMVEPHFTMFWADEVPVIEETDDDGRRSRIQVIAGELNGHVPPAPPPNSWASHDDSDVAIWSIALSPGASVTLPAGSVAARRTLYVFGESGVEIAEQHVDPNHACSVRPDVEVTLVAGDAGAELLMLQGRPIQEPIAQHGPFVMNYPGEIRRAMQDYEETQFGGWPWKSDAPVHDREAGRFAVHADGSEERRGH